MRMRRKKNLDTRLSTSSEYSVDLPTLPRDVRLSREVRAYIDTDEIFSRHAPVHLEIGCGRGGFVTEMARMRPDIDYIAVERISNVAVCAMERAKELSLPNVRILVTGAEYLVSYIKPHSVDRIYLNFSTPMMKNGYEVSRLTSPRLLETYKQMLISGGEIYQKTDDREFFEFSLQSYLEVGYKLRNVTHDLHASGVDGDVMTEYEKKFVSMGLPIYRVEAYLE